MSKTRLLAGVVAAVCLTMALAAPAFAAFKTTEKGVKVLSTSAEPQVFTAGKKAVVECKTSSFASTEPGTETESEQLKINASYTGCEAEFGGSKVSATVNMEGCDYNFHSAKGSTKGTTTVECGSGRSIKIATSGCEVEVPAAGNSNLSEVTYGNIEGKPKTVKVTPAVKGITTKVASGFFKEAACSIGGVSSGKEGEYKGSATVMGANSGGTAVSIEVG